jgi:hypothetical protein
MSVSASGCADLNYRSLELGQTREKYDGALPSESSRRTDLGLCQYSKNALGDAEAIVALLSSDRRIAARIRAQSVRRDYGFRVESDYRLEGEVDPKLYNTEQTGPIDTLRAIVHALAEHPGEKLANDAYAFIGGGLARLLLRWPGVEEIGIAKARLDEFLELAPAGGAAQISVDEAGRLRFSYSQSAAR